MPQSISNDYSPPECPQDCLTSWSCWSACPRPCRGIRVRVRGYDTENTSCLCGNEILRQAESCVCNYTSSYVPTMPSAQQCKQLQVNFFCLTCQHPISLLWATVMLCLSSLLSLLINSSHAKMFRYLIILFSVVFALSSTHLPYCYKYSLCLVKKIKQFEMTVPLRRIFHFSKCSKHHSLKHYSLLTTMCTVYSFVSSFCRYLSSKHVGSM